MTKPFITIVEIAQLFPISFICFIGHSTLSVVSIIVGLLAWRWLGTRLYLYFSVYTLAIMTMGFFGGFLATDGPLSENEIQTFRISVAMATFVNFSQFLFIRELVKPQEMTPRLYRMLGSVLILLSLADIFTIYRADTFSWNLRGQFFLAFAFLNLAIQFIAATKLPFVRWYVVGNILFILGNSPLVLMNMGFIPSFTPLTASLPFIGVLLQTFLFFIGLLDRLRHEYNRNLSEVRLKMLGTTAAEIFHELISPLTIILVNGMKLKEISDDITHKELSEELHRINDRIEHNLQRVSANIDKFRTFTGVSKNDDKLAVVLGKDIINGAQELAKYRIEKRGCRLEIDDPCSHSVYIKGNLFDFEQLVANLLTNAADAIKNLEDRWIQLQTKIDGNFFEIRVVDSGNGIPEEMHERIFSEFFTTKANGEGSGIGLALCKRCVEKYGGTLSLEEKSAHTCFTVRLPISEQA